jgi:hypothetical protein
VFLVVVNEGGFLRLSRGNDTNWLALVAVAKSPYLGLTLGATH